MNKQTDNQEDSELVRLRSVLSQVQLLASNTTGLVYASDLLIRLDDIDMVVRSVLVGATDDRR